VQKSFLNTLRKLFYRTQGWIFIVLVGKSVSPHPGPRLRQRLLSSKLASFSRTFRRDNGPAGRHNRDGRQLLHRNQVWLLYHRLVAHRAHLLCQPPYILLPRQVLATRIGSGLISRFPRTPLTTAPGSCAWRNWSDTLGIPDGPLTYLFSMLIYTIMAVLRTQCPSRALFIYVLTPLGRPRTLVWRDGSLSACASGPRARVSPKCVSPLSFSLHLLSAYALDCVDAAFCWVSLGANLRASCM
jgi:hypothetical protein